MRVNPFSQPKRTNSQPLKTGMSCQPLNPHADRNQVPFKGPSAAAIIDDAIQIAKKPFGDAQYQMSRILTHVPKEEGEPILKEMSKKATGKIATFINATLDSYKTFIRH